MTALLNSQFVQVALPLMVTLIVAVIANNKTLEVMSKRIEDVGKRIEDVGKRIDDGGKRVVDLGRRIEYIRNEMNHRFDKIDTLLREHDQRIVRLEERTSPLTRR